MFGPAGPLLVYGSRFSARKGIVIGLQFQGSEIYRQVLKASFSLVSEDRYVFLQVPPIFI